VSRLRVSLDRDPQAPSHARAAVARLAATNGLLAPALDTLTLLVSELVSNAVLHSDAPPASGILLHARVLARGTIRVEVTDCGSGFTAAPRDPSRVTGGYGLFLVAQEASRWGVDREGGTRVWFELTSSARREP
jgi:anti-sigma regulatory factor (Ser/Thr protein kinase)